MEATYKIFLDTRTRKSNGSFAIAIRVSFKRKTTTISTGFSAFQEEWNIEKATLKKTNRRNFAEIIAINNYLTKRTGQIAMLFQRLKFEDKLTALSPTELFALVKDEDNCQDIDFINVMEKYSEQLKKDGHYTNYGHFKSTIGVLRKFTGKQTLTPKNINLKFLESLEKYYLNQTIYRHGKHQRKCINGLAPHLRRIRVIINKLIRERTIEKSESPFNFYRIRTERTNKRNLDSTQLNKLLSVELKPFTAIWNARNYFMASYYMQGASFADVARLKYSDINGGLINYRRTKTNQNITVTVSQQLKQIIELYNNNKGANDYIFPIIKIENANEMQIARYIHSANIKTNDNLRILAEKANIGIKYISTYWARHSYATNLKRRNVPTAVISQGLGHSNINTTTIYLGELDHVTIANHNEGLFGELKPNGYNSLNDEDGKPLSNV